MLGQAVCWPRAGGLGGRPASIGVKFERLCESSWDFVRSEKGAQGLEDEKAACVFLANSAHARVQAGIGELVADGYVGSRYKTRETASAPKALAMDAPLLGETE